jgi:serine/threonine protein phosphatase PrpC
VDEDLALFVVADGLGGHAGGEIAAHLAAKVVAESFRSERTRVVLDAYAAEPAIERRRLVLSRLKRAVQLAHEAIEREVESQPLLTGMGTTLDVACLLRNKAFIAHVGDGRVYLSRPNTMLQLTQDHTHFDALKARGQVRPQARPSRRNRLLNTVGLGPSVAADTVFVELGRGDRLLLCTDGVHGQIDSEARVGELLRRGTAAEASKALVTEVSKRGRDNATALVIDIGERFVKPPESDRGVLADDLRAIRMSPLLDGLSEAALLSVLAAAVEVEYGVGESVPQAVANDLVAYIVLDGLIETPAQRHVTTGALLFAESLVAIGGAQTLPLARQPARLLRIRRDDFAEVCEADARLGSELYRRLAHHLARTHTTPIRIDSGAQEPAATGDGSDP